MKLSFKPRHLKRYKDIAVLFLKYSQSDFARDFELEETFEAEDFAVTGAGAATPEDLANDLEKMGPTFVKLGQLLSSRADLLPEAYLKALARLP